MPPRKKRNPEDFVPRSFCDERTKRIEQKIDSVKTDIINAVKEKLNPPMPWAAKATVIAAFITAVGAIIVALVT